MEWWLVALVSGGGRLVVVGWRSVGGVGGLALVHGGWWCLVVLVVGTGTCWPKLMRRGYDVGTGGMLWLAHQVGLHWWYVVVGTGGMLLWLWCDDI